MRRGIGSLAVLMMLGTMAGMSMTPHTHLKGSRPGDKARLSAMPESLLLTFTEPPELSLTHVRLLATGDSDVELGPLALSAGDNASVTARITGPLLAGSYTVRWETASDDGHPVNGTFTFTLLPEAVALAAPPAVIAPPAASASAGRDSLPPMKPRFDAESIGFVLVRFVLLASLLIIIGAVTFRGVVLARMQRGPNSDGLFVTSAAHRAARIGWVAACVLLAACLARLAAQSLALNGASAMADPASLGTLAMKTRWGRGWFIQALATIVAIVAFWRARRRDATETRLDWTIAAVAAAVLAFTPGFASHAAASHRLRSVAMLFDGLHVIGASGWLGSLVLVLAAGLPAAMTLRAEQRDAAVAELIRTFSPTALAFAALVASTGLFAAWLNVGSFGELVSARYGKVLLLKLAIVSLVAVAGAYHWLRVKPTLGTREATARIRRSASAEAIAALVILLVTAVLVATPPPMAPM